MYEHEFTMSTTPFLVTVVDNADESRIRTKLQFRDSIQPNIATDSSNFVVLVINTNNKIVEIIFDCSIVHISHKKNFSPFSRSISSSTHNISQLFPMVDITMNKKMLIFGINKR